MRRAIRLEFLQSAEPDCRIEAFGDEIDRALGVSRVDTKLRMARGELNKERCDVPQTERERHRDAQEPDHLVTSLCYGTTCLLEIGEDPLGAPLELRPRLGGTDAMRRPAEEPPTQVALEPRQAAADDRLG